MKKYSFSLVALLMLSFAVVSSAQSREENRVPKRATDSVLNSLAISLPSPVYPDAAKAIDARGSVSVRVLVDKQGSVESTKVISGHPLLRSAGEQAASMAKFKPFLSGGKPVKVSGVIVYYFGDKRIRKKPVSSSKTVTEVINGRAISLPAPKYPAAAHAICASGKVWVKVDIDKNGSVIQATAIQGHPLLRRSAIEAAKEAKFRTVDDPSKQTSGILVYKFRSINSCR